jgi:hypothetical protein
LGVVNLDLLAAYREKIPAAEQAALADGGITALQSLAPLYPRFSGDRRKGIEDTLRQLRERAAAKPAKTPAR